MNPKAVSITIDLCVFFLIYRHDIEVWKYEMSAIICRYILTLDKCNKHIINKLFTHKIQTLYDYD